jgi:hypothetical protein
MAFKAGTPPPGGGRQAHAARRRRSLAAAASAIAHLGLLAALLGSASGQIIAGDDGPGAAAMVVRVVAASSLRPVGEEPASQTLRPLFARFGSGQPPVTVDPKPRRAEMERLLDRLQPMGAAPTAPPPRLPDRADIVSPEPADGRRAEGQTPGRPGSTGGLWGSIEPCWTRLAGENPARITLEISLDARGRLSGPPKILRFDGPANEVRVRAEANALAALSACLAEGDVRFGGRVYRLEFQPSR